MRVYRNVDEVFSDRRKGVKLSEVVGAILDSPHIMEQIETPFDIIRDLYPNDYLDSTLESWASLPVELQIEYSSAYQYWYAKYSGYAEIREVFELLPGSEVAVDMILIPPMKYAMGSFIHHDEPIKMITIKKPSWMGMFEVTNQEWETVMDPQNPRLYLYEPVTRVTWNQCQDFCKKTGFELPHEKVWEMACRAGTTTRYSFGNTDHELGNYAWFYENAGHRTHRVGAKFANAWGLRDMHGNVSEWCDNWYFADKSHLIKATRGGAYESPNDACRSSFRGAEAPGSGYAYVGFRLWKPI